MFTVVAVTAIHKWATSVRQKIHNILSHGLVVVVVVLHTETQKIDLHVRSIEEVQQYKH